MLWRFWHEGQEYMYNGSERVRVRYRLLPIVFRDTEERIQNDFEVTWRSTHLSLGEIPLLSPVSANC